MSNDCSHQLTKFDLYSKDGDLISDLGTVSKTTLPHAQMNSGYTNNAWVLGPVKPDGNGGFYIDLTLEPGSYYVEGHYMDSHNKNTSSILTVGIDFLSSNSSKYLISKASATIQNMVYTGKVAFLLCLYN